jgi:hypothetical protein
MTKIERVIKLDGRWDKFIRIFSLMKNLNMGGIPAILNTLTTRIKKDLKDDPI